MITKTIIFLLLRSKSMSSLALPLVSGKILRRESDLVEPNLTHAFLIGRIILVLKITEIA